MAKAETYVGSPCKRGHAGLRYVSGRSCVECVNARRRKWESDNADHARALGTARKVRERASHPERNKKVCRKWYYSNVERARASARASGQKNARRRSSYLKAYMPIYAIRNRGRLNANAAAYRAARLQQTPKWADLNAIREFYAACPPGFHVDHIVPLRGRLVRGLHVLENLQYLPARDNLVKGNRF